MKVLVVVECDVPDEITATVPCGRLHKECQEAVEAAVARMGGFEPEGMSWPYYGLFPLRVPEKGVRVIASAERRDGP